MFKDFHLKLRIYCTQKLYEQLNDVDHILYDLMEHGELINHIHNKIYVKYKNNIYMLPLDEDTHESSLSEMWICSGEWNNPKESIFYNKRPSRYAEYRFFLWIENQEQKKHDVYHKFCSLHN